MSTPVQGGFIFEKEPPQVCTMCNKFAETRPYGPGGSEICIQCATASPEIRRIVDHNMDVYMGFLQGHYK